MRKNVYNGWFALVQYISLGKLYIQVKIFVNKKMMQTALCAYYHSVTIISNKYNYFRSMNRDFTGIHNTKIKEWTSVEKHTILSFFLLDKELQLYILLFKL